MTVIPTAPGRRTVLRPVALFGAALISLQILWVLALPAFFGMDEFDHAYRATSVADGHWGPGTEIPGDGRGFLIRVPDDIVAAAHDACSALKYTGRDNCTAVTGSETGGSVLVASGAATYNPVWYAVVGTVAKPFSGTTALFVMRLTNILLCDLMLLLAAALTLRGRCSSWPFLGVVLAAAPTLIYATSVAAPNGLCYASGVLLWAAGLQLARDSEADPRGPLFAVGAAGAVVMVTHTTGVLWVGLAAACIAPVLWPTVRRLARQRPRALFGTGLALALVAVACTAWVVLANTNDPNADNVHAGPMPGEMFISGPLLWTLQAVATLRFRDTPAPIPVYGLAMALLVVLLMAAVRAADRRIRITLLLLAVLVNVVPLALTYLTYDALGSVWQGRYTLPLSVGFVLVITHTLSRGEVAPWIRWTLVATMTAMHALTVRSAFPASRSGYLHDPVALLLVGVAVYLLAVSAAAREAALVVRTIPRTASHVEHA
ncbi:hypothetical protein BH11ACT8_BH11ACT8_06720 [soil metagenome]